ncbi:hypothetical protein ACFWB2_21425 [Streptomyces virginiae]
MAAVPAGFGRVSRAGMTMIDPLHGWIHGGRGPVACVASGFVWVVG